VALAHSLINARQPMGFSQNIKIGFRERDLVWLKLREIGTLLSPPAKAVEN